MTLKDLAALFNRSCEGILNLQKLLSIFFVLIVSGLVFLSFQFFIVHSPNWLKLPLIVIPFFITCFLLMLCGSDLCQPAKEKRFFFDLKNWLPASYFYFPLVLTAIVSAILFALLMLVKAIPIFGTFAGILLAFVPFLLNFVLLLLVVAAVCMLFFFTPLIEKNKDLDLKTLLKRFRRDIFTHLLHFIFALLPLAIIYVLCVKALKWTVLGYGAGDGLNVLMLQGLFILIPFAALLSFPLLFFFNFSRESCADSDGLR